jgi:glutathione reductase (NADPH)
MTAFDYDLFVIGAGSGGVRAARIAAGHGAKVAVAESYRVGGTCVIRGCVPKKLLVYGAHFRDAFEDAAGFGWSLPAPTLDWPTLRQAVQTEVSRLNGLYIQTLEKAGVTILNGHATFVDPHTLAIDGEQIRAHHVLIATGGWPVLPDAPGAELGITSNEAFHLESLPQRILIAGGGYIATEFAGIFNGLGSQVTQLYRGETILKGWDMELRQRLQATMIDKGITLHTKAIFERIEQGANGLLAYLTDGSVVEADVIMHAIGRKPNVAGLGLEKAGVALTDSGAIAVTPASQTSQPHIYAVGDVTDRIQLTPVAIKEGHAVADTLFGGKPWQADHDLVPSAVFSQPPLASVGMTEEQARASGRPVRMFRSDFRPMQFTLAGRQERSLCKLIVDEASDKVLGAHMIGPDAPEIIQAVAIAVKMGATKAQFDQTVAVHPSAAEEFVLMR